MAKNRIFYYDFLRAFAIIAVIMCHVDPFFGFWHDSGLKFILHSIFHGIGLIGVPIFLMLTGALLLNREYTLSDFLKRRFSRILTPFIFWIILIIAIGFYYFKWDYLYLFNIFIGNGSIMWYFWLLIGIYLFIPVINSFIKEYNFKGLEYFLVIWFVTIILKTFYLWPLFPMYELNTNFELNYFANFIGYVVLGYYIANKDFKFNKLKMILIGLIMLLISLSLYVYFDINSINIGPLYQNLTNVIMAIGTFLFIKYSDELKLFDYIKNNWIGTIIISISICSYGMYFAHFLIVKFFEQFGIHSNKFLPIMLFIIIFLSWIITYILSKIHYLKKFSGA